MSIRLTVEWLTSARPLSVACPLSNMSNMFDVLAAKACSDGATRNEAKVYCWRW